MKKPKDPRTCMGAAWEMADQRVAMVRDIEMGARASHEPDDTTSILHRI